MHSSQCAHHVQTHPRLYGPETMPTQGYTPGDPTEGMVFSYCAGSRPLAYPAGL